MRSRVFRILAAASFWATLLAAAPSAENRIVTIHLVAVDAHGEITGDLHREDLRVSEAGAKRNIVFLRRIGNEPWDPPPLGPHEISNRGGYFAPYATVVLLDLFNEDFSTDANASIRLAHGLAGIPNAESLFLYLLAVDGQLVPVHEIPADLHLHYRPSSSDPPWTAGIHSLLDAALAKRVGPARQSLTGAEHVNLTFQALDSLAVQLSRIPGRKNIILVNNGVPDILPRAVRFSISRRPDYSNELRILDQHFNSFGVALYSLRPFASSDSYLNFESEAALDQLVADSGGRSTGGVDIGEAVRQALRDARTSYQLGYEEPAGSRDGKIHKVRVVACRKAVHIQTEARYPAEDASSADFSRMLDAAALPPFDTAGIGLHGVLTRDPADRRLVHLRILLNARDLALIHKNNRYTGVLRLVVVGYEPSGRTADAPVVPYELQFHHGDRDHQQVLNAGIQFTQDVTVGARVTRIRLIVLDQTSQTVGTLTFPMTT